jgi:hypothetical protein
MIVGLLVLCSGCDKVARVRAALSDDHGSGDPWGQASGRDIEPDYDLLLEKKKSFARARQFEEFEKMKSWGAPSKECTSPETWTQRCGHHR